MCGLAHYKRLDFYKIRYTVNPTLKHQTYKVIAALERSFEEESEQINQFLRLDKWSQNDYNQEHIIRKR